MESTNSIFISATFNVFLSGVVGLVFYKLITVKHPPKTPIDYGRKWAAITTFIVSLASLPEFFRYYDTEPIARWIASLLFFGLLAFVLGILYGKLFSNKKGKPHDIATNNTVTNEAKTLESITNINIDDDKLYETAWNEVENKSTNKSLWARSFSECNGNKEQAKAKYIKLRVNELKSDKIESLKKEQKQKEEALNNRTDFQLMNDYRITFNGEHYYYEKYKYSKLSDAVNFAKIQQSKNKP